MKKEEKFIHELMRYYNMTLLFLHEDEKDEWMYLLKDVLNIAERTSTIDVRYLVSAMYFIIINEKGYTEEEQELYYRKMRVWSRMTDIQNIAFQLVDLLMELEEIVNSEFYFKCRFLLAENGYKELIPVKKEYNIERIIDLQKDIVIDKPQIKQIEEWFFEGHLYDHKDAIKLANTLLMMQPYSYHLMIFLMDKVIDHSINQKSIRFLEIFAETFEQVEQDLINQVDKDLVGPSNLREYCFSLSSIAMFYTEEEQFEKAIYYYEKLMKIDTENIFHAKEFSLRAYMFHGDYDKYSDMLEQLDSHSVYKRLLTLYRKIQLVEDDVEDYMRDILKDYGYLMNMLIGEENIGIEELPEIEEDFLNEYGLLFIEDEHVLSFIKEFVKKYDFTA